MNNLLSQSSEIYSNKVDILQKQVMDLDFSDYVLQAMTL